MSKAVKKVEAPKKVQRDEVDSVESFWKKYSQETSERVRIIDWFILYLIAVIAVQFFYRIIVGDEDEQILIRDLSLRSLVPYQRDTTSPQ